MGYTDCYFRLLAEKLYKSHITTFSEMIVDKAIIHNETKTIDKHFLENNISAIQIAGSEPIEIKLAIQKLNKIDRINHINLNLGCPSSRVQENKLGLALTQYPALVRECLYALKTYNKKISVKCRLGLGLEEDQNYIFEYLNMFQEFEIKTVYIHCRNGVLNLDTKKNRTIPKINYELFFKCKREFPNMELIPNGEINDLKTFNHLSDNNINQFMIGRQFANDLLFIEKLGLIEIDNKSQIISDYLDSFENYKYLNLNLLKKAIFTLLSKVKGAKKIKKDISEADSIIKIKNIFERNQIWN
ncbi:tRNA-dihydrouridine synthase family protein [Alphaproteobacteria bacterium]|nr:tRNA-dihydrouridine synthase family protein [Alphaproteobacteria bacterium]